MANGWRKLFGGSRDSEGDLEAFRQRMIEPPEDYEDVDNESGVRESGNSSNANTNDIRFDGIGRTGAIVLGTVAGLALGVAVFAQVSSIQSERETRLLEYYVMEVDGKLMQANIIKPDETWSARKRKQE